jgi:IS30 family transposase
MPKGYNHLTYDKRCQIYALLRRGYSQKEIAEDLGISQSTISRELRRNRGKKGYRYKQAEETSKERRSKASHRTKKMTPELSVFVEQKIRFKQLSPEQISGSLKNRGIHISHETIYKYVWKDKCKGGDLYKNLRHGGKKYNKRSGKNAGRGCIPNRTGIEERPIIVNKKERVGDYEIDTIIGANHKGAIVSIVERKTMFVRLALLERTTADHTTAATISLLAPIKNHVHTLTSDNGKEFAQHQIIAQSLDAQFFFARPYRSCDRGLNENINGLVRQYFPKKTVFSKLAAHDIHNCEFLLNSRPRKSLNYQTPIEVFLRFTGVNLYSVNLNYALRY